MEDLFSEYWKGAKKEIFRMAFPVFTYDEEELVRYKHYQETGELITDKVMSDWAKKLKERKGKGVMTIRLQVIDRPIPEFTLFEIKEQLQNMYAQKSFYLERKELDFAANGKKVKDYWVFDDSKVLIPTYNKEGLWLGFDTADEEETRVLIKIKKEAMLMAKPLSALVF